ASLVGTMSVTAIDLTSLSRPNRDDGGNVRSAMVNKASPEETARAGIGAGQGFMIATKGAGGRRMVQRSAVWQLAVAQTIVWAGLFYSFPALILRWETDFGWAKAELTGAVTLSIALSAVCSPLAGRLIDRGLGPRVLAGGPLAGGLCIGQF